MQHDVALAKTVAAIVETQVAHIETYLENLPLVNTSVGAKIIIETPSYERNW